MTARIFAVLVLIMGENEDKEHPSLYCCTRMSKIAIALIAYESRVVQYSQPIPRVNED